MLGRHLGIEEVKGEVSIAGKLSVMEQMSATIHSFPGAQVRLKKSFSIDVVRRRVCVCGWGGRGKAGWCRGG